MYVEKKWKTNAEKVAFAKSFPGRLTDWRPAAGKRIEHVVTLEGREVGAVIFPDGAFICIPSPEPEPADLIRTLLACKPFLQPYHKGAYEELDRWIATDREMQRMARLENILGAIRNNLPQIPELREALRKFLDDGEGKASRK